MTDTKRKPGPQEDPAPTKPTYPATGNTYGTGNRGETVVSTYADIARAVNGSGLGSALPLPEGKKAKPPHGFTGEAGRYPTEEESATWEREENPRSNVAIRFTPGVIAIDVDQHAAGELPGDGEKNGEETMAALARELGPLPPTFRIARRARGGHYLYRLPDFYAGARLGDPDTGSVETLRAGYRYSIAPGSRVDGACYRAYTPAGVALPVGTVPSVQELPYLPETWIERLLAGPEASSNASEEPDYTDLSPRAQEVARQAVEDVREHWRAKLARVATWPDEERDAYGGWERNTADAAFRLAGWALAPWAPYTPEQASADFHTWAREMIEDPGVGDKWPGQYDQAAKKPDSWPVAPWAKDLTCMIPRPDLFTASPVLAQVRQAAYARMLSPVTLLGWVLARVLLEIPPNVYLPPTVGARAPLNLGFAMVGRSGAGKSSLQETSRELLGWVGEDQKELEVPLGSGEGVAQTFLCKGPGKQPVLRPDPRALFMADEIDHLAATGHRDGSTIMPTLRSAVSGSTLGQANATEERRRIVPAGAYRAVFIVGVQPEKSGFLLDDADGGTPQRFLWLPTTDPDVPEDGPGWPGALHWDCLVGLLEEPEEIVYPHHIVREIKEARLKVVHGDPDADPLESHALLTRLKVAVALTVLHSQTQVTEDAWEWAGLLMDESREQQAACRRALTASTEERVRSQGRLQVLEEEGHEEAMDEWIEAGARAVYLRVKAHAEKGQEASDCEHDRDAGCTSRCFRKALRRGRRKHEDEIIAHAIDEGWVVQVDGRYRLGAPPE